MSVPYSKTDELFDEEKGSGLINTVVVESDISQDDVQSGLYDPSKESIWTRLGLSPESFKRAPGGTG